MDITKQFYLVVYENNTEMMKKFHLLLINHGLMKLTLILIKQCFFETSPGADVEYDPAEVGRTVVWINRVTDLNFKSFQMPEKMAIWNRRSTWFIKLFNLSCHSVIQRI